MMKILPLPENPDRPFARIKSDHVGQNLLFAVDPWGDVIEFAEDAPIGGEIA